MRVGVPRYLTIIVALVTVAAIGSASRVSVRAAQAPVQVADARARDLAIVGATLIDGTGAAPRSSVNIIITGGRISKIGPSASTPPPAGVRVIQAAGKFVVPGLWDAHIHSRDYYSELLISYGITSYVDWGGSPLEWTLAQREAVKKGELYGPRFFTGGEMVRDSADPEGARRQVRELKAKGVDMITFGFGIGKEALVAAIDEAHKVGLPSSGYPLYSRAAIEAGITALKHTYTVGAANVTDPGQFAELEKQLRFPEMDQHDPKLFLLGDKHDELVKLMVEKKVAWVPTFIKDFKVINDRRDEFELENYRLLSTPDLQYLPVSNLMTQLTNTSPTGFSIVASGNIGTLDRSGAEWQLYRRSYKNIQDFIKKLVNAGGHVLPGTAPHSFVLPGLSLHQELQLFIDAGLTPMQAIQSATLWSAEFVRADKDLGSVAEGKLGDVVILSQNPLENIRNLRSIDTVVQGGRVLPTGYHWWYSNPLPRTGTGAPGEGPRAPQVDAASPGAVAEGTKDLTLTIRGKFFTPTSIAFFERVPLPTTVVSPTEIKAVVPERLLRTVGTYGIRVRTPRPGGGDSGVAPLTVMFP
jgi:hypothetical protein